MLIFVIKKELDGTVPKWIIVLVDGPFDFFNFVMMMLQLPILIVFGILITQLLKEKRNVTIALTLSYSYVHR